MELDQQCKDAGITVMNEIGLDPGIDHLYAVKTIEEVHEAGKHAAISQAQTFLRHQSSDLKPSTSSTDTTELKAERLHLSYRTVEDSHPQKTQETREFILKPKFPFSVFLFSSA